VAATVLCFVAVDTPENDFWIPLVDEPVGTIVAEIQSEHPEIDRLVASPQRLLAFRTFAYMRVGILLGSLLVERDVDSDGAASWAEQLLREPEVREQVTAEIRAVSEEIVADPAYASDPPVGPDDAERARFRDFAKRRLAADT
jgi:hypothetical protein